MNFKRYIYIYILEDFTRSLESNDNPAEIHAQKAKLNECETARLEILFKFCLKNRMSMLIIFNFCTKKKY